MATDIGMVGISVIYFGTSQARYIMDSGTLAFHSIKHHSYAIVAGCKEDRAIRRGVFHCLL